MQAAERAIALRQIDGYGSAGNALRKRHPFRASRETIGPAAPERAAALWPALNRAVVRRGGLAADAIGGEAASEVVSAT